MGKVAAAIAVVASVFTAVGATAVVATTLATVTVGVVAAAGAVAIANKMAKSMTPELGTAAEFEAQGAQGIMVNKTGSSQSIPVIYGETRTGGIRVFAETSGTDNLYLHLAFAISEGEINKCSEIFFDGVSVGSQTGTGAQDWADDKIISKYRGKVKMYFRPGTDGQTEISQLGDLKGSWSPHFKGVAYAYLRLEFDEDVWKNGVPEITFNVEGKKVRDPDNLSSVVFSDNPAWCILDYLTNTRYGKGLADADLDMSSFEAAGVYCDTKGFELRGNLSTNGTIHANVIDLLSSCRGYLTFGNKYRLLIDKVDTTADEDIFAITKDNTVGNVDYILGDKSTMFNKMTAKFIDASTEYKDNIKVVASSSLKTADNGMDLEAEIPMPYVKTASVVEQILIEEINQSRQSHMIQLKCTVDAIDLQVGDLVKVTNETFGITEKKFRVLNTLIEPSSEVTLVLREYDADVYGSSIISDELADNND